MFSQPILSPSSYGSPSNRFILPIAVLKRTHLPTPPPPLRNIKKAASTRYTAWLSTRRILLLCPFLFRRCSFTLLLPTATTAITLYRSPRTERHICWKPLLIETATANCILAISQRKSKRNREQHLYGCSDRDSPPGLSALPYVSDAKCPPLPGTNPENETG